MAKSQTKTDADEAWGDDDVVVPTEIVELADEILADGLHVDLRDQLEVLVEARVPQWKIRAAVRLICDGRPEREAIEIMAVTRIICRRAASGALQPRREVPCDDEA